MRLYGREAETARLDELLASARAGRSGVLMLRGEPGIGKTALLRYAKEQASGMTVLEARGLEGEAQLAFSGLADLFRLALDQLESIPPFSQRRWRGRLVWRRPRQAIASWFAPPRSASWPQLRNTSPSSPSSTTAHWLDEASREALLFAARRLEAERVALLMTSLDLESEPGAPAAAGFDELALSRSRPPSGLASTRGTCAAPDRAAGDRPARGGDRRQSRLRSASSSRL